MKELAVRAASGAVYAALVLGAAWCGPWCTAALFLPICVIGAGELRALQGRPLPFALMAFVAAAFYATIALWPLMMHSSITSSGIAGLLGLLLITLFLLRQKEASAVAQLMGSAFYLAMPFACSVWLVAIDPLVFIGFMLLLWTNDTGAYLVGKAIGRRKLMPSVSPGKTWEGFFGGAVAALAVAWLIANEWSVLSLTGWLIAAACTTIAGTAGDLFESALKRKAGVKDSGRIMPGHGGALDRFDGYLLAAPVMMLIAQLFG